ncbi:MAG: GxxExxY protein [Anaerolineaceae bacterium]
MGNSTSNPDRQGSGDLLYRDEVYQTVGAAMEVHSVLGCGFLEAVYHEAMEKELAQRNIPFTSQTNLTLTYKGLPLSKSYIADLVVFSKIIVELKAVDRLTSVDEAQVLNYLKATGMQVGLLFNFGSGSLQWKRLILTSDYRSGRNLHKI